MPRERRRERGSPEVDPFLTSRAAVAAVPAPAAFNPYAPPDAFVADVDAGVQLAGRGRRLANLMLDSVFAGLLFAVLQAAAGLAGHPDSLRGHDWAANQLMTSAFSVLYYFVQESLWGVTLAKLITGTRVLTETGGTPSARQILGRSLARLVPFEPFSFLGGDPVGWHDTWSNTRVFVVRLRRSQS